jgi:hypothetical protein
VIEKVISAHIVIFDRRYMFATKGLFAIASAASMRPSCEKFSFISIASMAQAFSGPLNICTCIQGWYDR